MIHYLHLKNQLCWYCMNASAFFTESLEFFKRNVFTLSLGFSKVFKISGCLKESVCAWCMLPITKVSCKSTVQMVRICISICIVPPYTLHYDNHYESIDRPVHIVLVWNKFLRDEMYQLNLNNMCIKFVHHFVQDTSLCMLY